MKIGKFTEPTGSWGLVAEPEDYDATPPLGRILFDRQPRVLSPDRVAMASYLIFGNFASARFTTPQWHSPAVAEAIGQDSRPAWLQTEPVELYAKALPIGKTEMTVTFDEHPVLREYENGRYLVIQRSDRASGASMSFRGLTVCSNAWLLAKSRAPEGYLRVLLASALLYAEDLEADSVRVTTQSVESGSIDRLSHLLSTVRLGLEIEFT